MAQLTDEEKAALVASGEEPVSTLPEQTASEEPQEQVADEPEKPAEPQQEPEHPTFTKKFSNLKGENWEEYGSELETAYNNSFGEGLRLNRELEDAKKELAEARRAILSLQDQQPAGDPQPQQTPAAPVAPSAPELQYAKALMDRDMRQAFDHFADAYPQVRDQANFTRFRDAATPVGQAFLAVEGREPTYEELFPKIAALLGWQPAAAEGQHDQSLKESLSQGHTASGQTARPPRQARVTDAQVDAYLKFFPSKARADAVRELEEAIA